MTQALPDEVAGAMRAMRRARDRRLDKYLAWAWRQNWTMTQIGEAAGVSRQAVGQRIRRWLENHPAPGRNPEGMPIVPYLAPQVRAGLDEPGHVLTLQTRSHLLGLWMISTRVRGSSPADSPAREASAEFDRAVVALLDDGATLGQIARDIGVEQQVLRKRLARHGITAGGLRGRA